MSKNDNEPAFPVLNPATNEQYSGMTLRDYFAGQALMGLVAKIGNSHFSSDLANHIYELADYMLVAKQRAEAMLVEREKEKS